MQNITGEKIHALLKRKGMTQKELAKRAGLTEASISRYITGDRTPTSANLATIAGILGTSFEFLLDKEEKGFETEYKELKRLIQKNVTKMSMSQKKKIIDALLFGEVFV